jgi:hypothetical protein
MRPNAHLRVTAEHVFERVHQHTSEYGFQRGAYSANAPRSADSPRKKIMTGSRPEQTHDFAAGAAAQSQIDDGSCRTMSLDRIDAFVGGFGGHHCVLPHLQELHERLSDGAVIFDDENDWRCFSYHVEIIVLTTPQRYS